MNLSQASPDYDSPTLLLNELRPHHQQSSRWALTCCNGLREEAEDLLQDIYLEIISGKLKYRRESTPRVWLFGVIRVSSINRRRKLKRRLQLLALHVQNRLHTLSGITGTDPSTSYQQHTQQREVLTAIASLSPQQRKIIELVFYHELTIAESARICEMSLGSARTHYQRGKRNLEVKLRHLNTHNTHNTHNTQNIESNIDISSQPLTYGVSDER